MNNFSNFNFLKPIIQDVDHNGLLTQMIDELEFEYRENHRKGPYQIKSNGKVIFKSKSSDELKEQSIKAFEDIAKGIRNGDIVDILQGGKGDKFNYYGINNSLQTLFDMVIFGKKDYSINSDNLHVIFSRPKFVRTEYKQDKESFEKNINKIKNTFSNNINYIFIDSVLNNNINFVEGQYSIDIKEAYKILIKNAIEYEFGNADKFGTIEIGINKGNVIIISGIHQFLALKDFFDNLDKHIKVNFDNTQFFIKFLSNINIKFIDYDVNNNLLYLGTLQEVEVDNIKNINNKYIKHLLQFI